MRRYLRWILGCAVCLGPVVELGLAFVQAAGDNWMTTAAIQEFWGNLHARHYIVSSLLAFTGWGIVTDRSWAKRAGFMIILSITFGHIILLSFSKKFHFMELLPGILANLTVAIYLYRDEFSQGFFVPRSQPKPLDRPAAKPLVSAVEPPVSTPAPVSVAEPPVAPVSLPSDLPLTPISVAELPVAPAEQAPESVQRSARVKMKVHRRIKFGNLGLVGWISKVDKEGIWIKWDQSPSQDFRSDKEIVFTSGPKRISMVFSHHEGELSRLIYRKAWVEEPSKAA